MHPARYADCKTAWWGLHYNDPIEEPKRDVVVARREVGPGARQEWPEKAQHDSENHAGPVHPSGSALFKVDCVVVNGHRACCADRCLGSGPLARPQPSLPIYLDERQAPYRYFAESTG